MNPPVHTSWSVAPWGRYDDHPPELPPVTLTDEEGYEWIASQRVDPAWQAAHWHEGVAIADDDRGVTYLVTLDERGRIDYLSVVLSGDRIDENLTRRVPVDRIRRVARVHLNEMRRAEPGTLIFTPPGGVRFGPDRLAPGHRGDKPPLEEIRDRMVNLGEGRHEIAAAYGRKVRTVDGWVRQARQQGLIPETRRELKALRDRNRQATAHQNPDDDQSSVQKDER